MPTTLIIVIIIGLLGGIAVGLQGPLASLISQRIGAIESAFIVHLGGAVAALIILIAIGGGRLDSWRTVPWYALGAGVLGLILISSISYAIPRLGIATTLTLIVVGQLGVGAILDHFGLLGAAIRPLDLSRLIGLGVIFIGIWLMVR